MQRYIFPNDLWLFIVGLRDFVVREYWCFILYRCTASKHYDQIRRDIDSDLLISCNFEKEDYRLVVMRFIIERCVENTIGHSLGLFYHYKS